MIKVLQIVQTLNVCGGIENFIMNYYRNIDRDKVQFDYLIHEINEENFKDEVESLGGNVYLLPPFSLRNLKYILQYLRRFYLEHGEYDIIHCHMANAAPFHFYFANRNSKPIRIEHSHQPAGADKITHKIRNKILLKIADAMADVRMASSMESGRFLFGNKDFTVIHNAVDVERMQKSNTYRSDFRKRTDLDRKFVIGHIGRFAPVKNHKFILQVFKRLRCIKADAVLFLIGDGEKRKEIIKCVKDADLENSVIFVDSCREIEKYYSLFDVFIFPSLFEGFGLVAVEAQYAGVPVIASKNRVPEDVAISNYIHFLPLDSGYECWVEKILEISMEKKTLVIRKDDYDIKKQAKTLENIYLELAGKYGNT